MTEPNTDQPAIPQVPQPQKGVPRGKMPSTIAFGIGIFLFFLPFVDIRCNNMSLQTVNGAELATGFKIKGMGSDNSLLGGLNRNRGNTRISSPGPDQKDPNVYALAALALGALGFLLSVSNTRLGGVGGVLAGSLSAISLIGLMVDIRQQLKSGIEVNGRQTAIGIAVEFTPWFYLAILVFAAAAYFSYKRMKT